MNVTQQITLGIIIFAGASIALALLWGKFVSFGSGQDTTPPEQANRLADRLDALIIERKAAELAWMAELQDRIAEREKELRDMEVFPTTHGVIKLRTMIRVQIDGDKRALELLRKRGEAQRWEHGAMTNAASHWEGRM